MNGVLGQIAGTNNGSVGLFRDLGPYRKQVRSIRTLAVVEQFALRNHHLISQAQLWKMNALPNDKEP